MYALPLPEDGLSLREVLAYTVDMVLAKRTTADEARGIGEPCRVMEKNMELRSGAGSHGPRRQS